MFLSNHDASKYLLFDIFLHSFPCQRDNSGCYKNIEDILNKRIVELKYESYQKTYYINKVAIRMTYWITIK